MAVSANALFHFTSSINIVKSILENGFYPRYCMEKRDFLNVYPASELRNSASPMVCFCDIPLSLINQHANEYGRYGIGINKELAQRLNLQPVTYVSSKSKTTKYINYSYAALKKYHPLNEKPIKELMDLDYLHGEALDAIFYLKSYEGKNWRKKSFAGKKICFYDEREWRFVPEQVPLMFADVPRFLSRDLFIDIEALNELNKKLEICKLPINEKIIQYIIVSQDSEVRQMVNIIMNLDEMCGYQLSVEDKGMLCTKIISMERIESDF